LGFHWLLAVACPCRDSRSVIAIAIVLVLVLLLIVIEIDLELCAPLRPLRFGCGSAALRFARGILP
jgi:hypothetical protein